MKIPRFVEIKYFFPNYLETYRVFTKNTAKIQWAIQLDILMIFRKPFSFENTGS